MHYFERVQDRVISFVEAHSAIPKGKYRELMLRADVIANELGTLVYGPEAVELGLIDALGSLSDALEKLHGMIDGERKKREKGG